MFRRPADRTGHPVRKPHRQDARLLVQKRPVLFLEVLPRLRRLALGPAIGCLRLPKLRLQVQSLVRRALNLAHGPLLRRKAILFLRQPQRLIASRRERRILLFQRLHTQLAGPSRRLCLPPPRLHLRLPGRQRLQFLLLLVIGIVVGEVLLQGRRLPLQFLRIRQLRLSRGQRILRQRQRLPFPLFFRLGFPQGGGGLLELLHLSDVDVHRGEIFLHTPQRLGERFLLPALRGDQLFQHLHLLRLRQRIASHLLDPRPKRIILSAHHALQMLMQTLLLRLALPAQVRRLRLQPLLEDLIGFCLKDVAKDGLPVPGLRQQELQKIPLGQHGDL